MSPWFRSPPATITNILRHEPGLLLEVKRLLVRKAYEQGRLLDPADLTDDALFQLLQEDNNARVLATQEIEKREYVRPKPTREEMEKDRIGDCLRSGSAPASANGAIRSLRTKKKSIGPERATRLAGNDELALPRRTCSRRT